MQLGLILILGHSLGGWGRAQAAAAASTMAGTSRHTRYYHRVMIPVVTSSPLRRFELAISIGLNFYCSPNLSNVPPHRLLTHAGNLSGESTRQLAELKPRVARVNASYSNGI